MEYTFDVDGLPPKKDGASSMWGKRAEIARIHALRRKAAGKLAGVSLAGPIELRMDLRIKADAVYSAGDLDNFLTGIFDGLQACAPGTSLAAVDESELDWSGIYPTEAIAYADDAWIVSVAAIKRPADDRGEGYTLTLADFEG